MGFLWILHGPQSPRLHGNWTPVRPLKVSYKVSYMITKRRCLSRVLIKPVTSLLYFHSGLLQQATLIKELGLCNENHILFFLNLYEFKRFGANIVVEEFATKGYKKTTLNNFETIERLTTAASRCSLVWCTEGSCQWGDWRMESTSPGLCPCKGTPFSTPVVIMDATCRMLTFPRWMAEHFMVGFDILLQ